MGASVDAASGTAAPARTPAAEIREWAKATGRGDRAGERGDVPADLRAEYDAEAEAIGAGPPIEAIPSEPAAPAKPRRGADKPPAASKGARAEKTPAAPVQGRGGSLGKLKGWFSGTTAGPDGKPKPKSSRPRTPLNRLATGAWRRVASIAEHVNVPVARTMAWQAPFIGVVADDLIDGTPIDKILQPLARAEEGLAGAASIIAMPILVGMITSPRNNPEEFGLAAAVRQQLYHQLLAECIDAQLELFGNPEFAQRIRRTESEQSARSGDIDRIMGMIFADIPPAPAEPADAAEAQATQAAAQQAAAQEDARRAAVAITALIPEAPDERGRAAELAAARMAAAGQKAAEQAAQVNGDPATIGG
jgi:hypothetical protein